VGNAQGTAKVSRSLAATLATLLTFACVAAALVKWRGQEEGWLSPDPLGLLAALVAAAFAARTAFLTSGGMRFAWGMLCPYIAIYGCADALNKGLITGTPETTLSDAVYLAAFVPAGIGLLLYPILELVRGMWRPLLIDAVLLVSSVTYFLHTFVLSAIFEADLDLVSAVIVAIYPLISSWCAALTLLVLARSEGAPRPDAVLLGLAYVVFALGDQGYVFLTVRGLGTGGTWVDAAYTVAPLVLAAAAATGASVPTPRRTLRRHLSRGVTPVLSDLFALTALALASLFGPRDGVSIVLGLVTIVTLSIRQIALTQASWRLRAALERRIEERTRELQETTEHYERLDALKREFITAVSHELRTPLAAIRGGLEMLEDGDAGELNPVARKLVTTASRGSERLSRLVNDIIDLERLDGGAFEHAPSAQPVGCMVRDAVQAMATLSAQHRVDVRVDVEEADVWCDPDPVVQVLVNLLGNALKFSDDGTTVFVSSRRDGDEVVVSVRDEGRGIPPEELERIFKRFHQVEKDDSREKGGAGLGLSICQRIVENHGGRIWAESQEGEGATFLFTLPVAPTVPVAPVVPAVEPVRTSVSV